MYDLWVKGGIVVSGKGERRIDLGIIDGKIAALLEPGHNIEAREILEAEGRHIFPGIIDGHCHMRDPGNREREDFWSGTQAAAAGGITTVCEMPISVPPVYSGEILRKRKETVQPRALIDFALYGTAGGENLDEIEGLAEAGACAYKTFLHPAEPGREKEFFGLICADAGSQYETMEAVAKTGLRHCLHCETNEIIKIMTKRLKESGRTDGHVHTESRPDVCENTSVALSLAAGAALEATFSVCHVSSADSLQLIKEAKARGVQVTAETCPSYIFLNDDSLTKHGAYAKNNPPLRSEENRLRLWEYINDGTVDYLATDHAPWPAESKDRGIYDANAGIPSFEMFMPLLLDAVNRGMLTSARMVQLTSEKPAEVFHFPGKGRLETGCDADFVLVDMTGSFEFDMNRSHSKAGTSMQVFHGMKLSGRVISTWVRGRKVQEDGVTTAPAGTGRFIRPVL